MQGTPGTSDKRLHWPSILGAMAMALSSTAGAADEAPPHGALGRTLFGEEFGKESGLRLGGWLEFGLAVNNHDDTQKGLANAPVVIVRDEGPQLNQLYLYLERDMQTNIIPRVTPTPAPVFKDYSWGFHVSALYGRDGQPPQRFGWDSNLSVNQPGNSDPAKAAESRQLFLVYPQAYATFYMPWGLGMAAMVGNFMSPIGHEIGFATEPTPNIFYSRTYAFAAAPIDHTGALLAINLMKNQSGLLAAELGIVQGWSNFKDNNDQPAYLGALRYRTPDMRHWIDYEVITGDAQADPGKIDNSSPSRAADTINAPVTRVISPNGLNKTEHHLTFVSQFTDVWKGVLEFTYGRMEGDGAATTIDIVNGPGFTGAKWRGVEAQVQYKYSGTLAFAGRLEQFRDRDGFALLPNTVASGDFNEATFGAQWRASKHVLLRPELRYDWQSHKTSTPASPSGNAFADGTKDSQWLVAADLIFYF